ncbi:MAG: murein hydrolase activator EnvC family protein [Pseudomonadota bacterium]
MASRRGVLLAVLLGVPVILPGPLGADTISEADLEDLRQRIDRAQAELRELEGERDEAENRLREVDRAVGRASRQLAETEQELTATRDRLAELEAEHATHERRLSQEHGALGEQVRALYQAGEQDALRVLLSQDDPSAVGRMLVWADYISEARRERIDAIRESLAELERLKKKIAEEEQRLEERRTARTRDREALAERRAERREVLQRLESRASGRREDLREMERDEDHLESLLGDLEGAAPGEVVDVAGRRGRLDWPVTGRIRAAFGSERESGMRWRGLFITTEAGEPARAPAPGRVVFADWMRGYGLLLILDHGNGFMSLYGHSEGLLADIGDWVEEGAPVVLTGRSGGYREPGLYLEIRRDGRPVDPVAWLRPR